MRCVWCDSEYTFTGGDHFSIDSIMEQVNALGQACRGNGRRTTRKKEAFKLIERLCNDGFSARRNRQLRLN